MSAYMNPNLEPGQYAQYSSSHPPTYASLPAQQHYGNVQHIQDTSSNPSLIQSQRQQNLPASASNPLASKSLQQGGKEFSLIVRQQPDRARMCGFGDKDRRPITPPPCVELIIKDIASGRQLGPNDVDFVPYVLNVDLWDGEGRREVNLVRSSNSAPTMSISMATTTSYPPPPDPPAPGHIVPVYGPNHTWTYQMMNPSIPQPGYGGYAQPMAQAPYPMQSRQHAYATPHTGPGGTGMFTRNLIGSVTVSAAALTNLENKLGCWFVLQDLSVRQEGTFRLKLSFVNVGGPSQGTLNTGACPILAETFSEPFTVWSAKKFPGVKESTQLSKNFASQGVKIPIRKDNSKAGGKDDQEDDE